MKCNVDKNKQNCSCTYEPCTRKGICCECVKYHRDRNAIPACFFPPDIEKTYNRSLERFISCFK